MSRAHLYKTIQAVGGSLVSGATVTLFETGTTTPIAQTMYGSDGGTDVVSNPFQATTGVIDVYLPNPQDVDIQISYGSSTLLVRREAVLPRADGIFAATNPVTITNAPSPGYLLQGVDATHAQFVDPTTVVTNRPDITMPTLSTPTTVVRNGLGFVLWDGLDNTGAAMPVGFSHAVLFTTDDLGNPVGLATFKQAGGVVVNATAGVSLQLQAINTAGNPGPVSAASAYPSPTSLVRAGFSQTTVGAAGGAAVLPATPVKYLPVVADDGTTYVIPLYSIS